MRNAFHIPSVRQARRVRPGYRKNRGLHPTYAGSSRHDGQLDGRGISRAVVDLDRCDYSVGFIVVFSARLQVSLVVRVAACNLNAYTMSGREIVAGRESCNLRAI